MEKERSKRHFLLVHGACHGAWCWYKLATLLESAGHQVTAVDLAACGVHPKRVDEIGSIHEYVGPLMELMTALPPSEKVVLVGHSLGGVAVSVAMEAFPEKIAAAVFVAAAMMPAPHAPAADVSSEAFRRTLPGSMLDCQFQFDQNELPTSMEMGPRYLSSKLYNCCPPEDLRLAMMLVRPTRLFSKKLEDDMLTEERFGSVARVYVLCKEDEMLREDLKRWIIERAPVNEVEEIEGADHMAMLSKPQELFNILSKVIEKYF